MGYVVPFMNGKGGTGKSVLARAYAVEAARAGASVLMADLDDDTTIILAEGMSNARDFRAMLPHLIELCPDLQLDPPDMGEQLRQALNSRRAWTLTCYGAIALVCISLYLLYLIVVFIGVHHP